MRTASKPILKDARNGFLGNGAHGMGQIPHARNLHPGCGQTLQHLLSGGATGVPVAHEL